MDAPSSVTNSYGMACVPAHAGTQAGSCTVTATMSGSSLLQTFHLSTVAGPASQLHIEGGNLQTAAAGQTFADPLLVRVTDAWGNPVSGAYVDLNDSNPLHGWHAWSDAQGLAGTIWPAGTVAGPLTVTAGIPYDNALASAVFELAIASGPPASIAVSSGSPQSAFVGEAFGALLVAIVRDAHGNPVPGATVTWSAPTGGATATLATPTPTDGSGYAPIAATAGTVAGGYTVAASINGGAAHVDFALTNGSGPAASLVMSGVPASPVAGSAFGFTVVARDAYSNLAMGYRGTVGFISTDAAATLPPDYVFTSDDAGSHLFNVALRTAGVHSLTVTDTSAPLAAASAVDVRAGVPAGIQVEGGDQHALVNTQFPQPLDVRLFDSWHNPVPGATVTVVAMGSAGYPADGSLRTDDTGAATTTLMAGTTAGPLVILFFADGGEWTSRLFTIDPGEPAVVRAISGSHQSARVDSAFTQALVARVEDVFGNRVPSAVVDYAVPSEGPTALLSGESATTDEVGRVSVWATAGTIAGSAEYRVTASLQGLTAEFWLKNTPGPAVAIAVASGSPQTATVGRSFQASLVALVADVHGNGVSAVSVTWSLAAGTAFASLWSTAATSDALGHAANSATAGTALGSYEVRASAAGIADSAVFSIVNAAGPAASIAVAGGSPQTATVGGTFSNPLQVVVWDTHMNPVAGAEVAFDVPAEMGSVVSPAPPTDSSGRTSVFVTAGTVVGTYLATARLSDNGPSAKFFLANVLGDSANGECEGADCWSSDACARPAGRLSTESASRVDGLTPFPSTCQGPGACDEDHVCLRTRAGSRCLPKCDEGCPTDWSCTEWVGIGERIRYCQPGTMVSLRQAGR